MRAAAEGGYTAPSADVPSAGRLPSGPLPPFQTRLLSAAAIGLALLILLASHFDAFSGDELYFIIAGRHPSWGYVDAPPMTALMARLGETVLPHSSLGLRVWLALFLPCCLLLTALIARELGGAKKAQLLAAATFVISPQVLSFARWLTNDVVDMTLWSLGLWLILRWLRVRDDRLLLILGAVTALALQNKYSIAILWVFCSVGLGVFGPRELFRKWQIWAVAGIGCASVVPSLLWQAGHEWRGLQMGVVAQGQFATAASYGAGTLDGRLIWLPALLGSLGLVGTVLFCVGLWSLVRPGSQLRFLGWTVVALTLLLWADDLPTHLLAGLFPLCWAAGAVSVENGVSLHWLRWVPTWPTIVVSLIALIAAMVPVRNVAVSRAEQSVLAYHDDNWAGLARHVSQAVNGLPSSGRDSTIVIAGDYQRSSALQWLQGTYHLPPVYGDMRGYWNFGTPPDSPGNIIYVDQVPMELSTRCREFRLLEWYVDVEPTGQPTRTPIYLCSGLTMPMSEIWPQLWTMSTPPGASS